MTTWCVTGASIFIRNIKYINKDWNRVEKEDEVKRACLTKWSLLRDWLAVCLLVESGCLGIISHFFFPPLYLFASHIELSFSLTMSFLTFALLIPYSIPLRVWVIMWMLSCWLTTSTYNKHLDDLEEWVYKIQQMLPWTSWLLKKFDWGGINTTLKCKICSVSLL